MSEGLFSVVNYTVNLVKWNAKAQWRHYDFTDWKSISLPSNELSHHC